MGPVNGWWKRRNKKRERNEEGTGTQRNEFEALRWDDVINLIYTRACSKRTRTVPLFGAHLGWSGRGCGRKYVDTHARARPCLRLNTHRSTSYTGWIASCRQAALSGYEILENLWAHATNRFLQCTPIMEFSVKHAIGMGLEIELFDIRGCPFLCLFFVASELLTRR